MPAGPEKQRKNYIRRLAQVLPSGFQSTENTLYWSSRGGFRGETSLRRSVELLKVLGFLPRHHEAVQNGSTPDGSVVSTQYQLENAYGDILNYQYKYGVTKADNSYSLQIKLTRVEVHI